MRIVHIADLHLGKSLFDYSLTGDQRAWLASLVAFLHENKADVLIISGDVYHRSVPPADAVALLDDFLNEVTQALCIPVLMVAGNHDSAQRLSFAARLTEKSGLYVAGGVRRTPKTVVLRDEYGEVCFVLLPYFEPYEVRRLFGDSEIKTFNDAFAALAREGFAPLDFTRRNVLVAHGFFGRDASLARFSDSERSVGGTELMDSALLEPFDYVALGHLHAPQTAGAEHIRYAGSPLKYSLSEAEQHKSVTLATLGRKGELSITTQELAPPHDLRIVTGTMAQLTDKALQSTHPTEDYVYAVITDKREVYNAAEKLRAVFPNLVGLRREADDPDGGPLMAAGLHVARRTPEELFADFYHDMLGEEPTPERAALVHDAVREALARQNADV